MIYEQRDPEFWRDVAADPAVSPSMFGIDPEALDAVISHPNVLPLASENGGMLFTSRCGFAKVWELHTLYKPQGWGREVLFAAKQAFARLFGEGAEIVFTHEQTSNWRTRPPKSFGFRPQGEPFESMFGMARLWILTKAAWADSPAQKRMEAH